MFVVEESRNVCLLTERAGGRGDGDESVETDDTLRGAGDIYEGMSFGCPNQNAFFIKLLKAWDWEREVWFIGRWLGFCFFLGGRESWFAIG